MGVQVPLSAPDFKTLTRQPLDPEGLVAVCFGPYPGWILTSVEARRCQLRKKQMSSLNPGILVASGTHELAQKAS